MALENLSHLSRSFGSNTTEIDEVLSIIGDDVGLTIDFCHAETTGQTLRLLEKYHNQIYNVHLSNREHRTFHSETPELKKFLNKLEEYGYTGPLIMELSSTCTTEEILKTKVIIANIIG